LLKHATEYYAELFVSEPHFNINLDPAIWENTYKITDSDNSILCKPFSEEEIKEALFQMEKNKAPGHDKIPIEFYQVCWGIVKKDIMQLFADFHKGEIDISRMNYGIITLLPKITDACKI